MSTNSPQQSCNHSRVCMFDYLQFVERVNQVFEDPPSINVFLNWGRAVLSLWLSTAHMQTGTLFESQKNDGSSCFSIEQFRLLLSVLSTSYVAGIGVNELDEHERKSSAKTTIYRAVLNDVKAQFSAYWREYALNNHESVLPDEIRQLSPVGRAIDTDNVSTKKDHLEREEGHANDVFQHRRHSEYHAHNQNVSHKPINDLSNSAGQAIIMNESELSHPQVVAEIDHIELDEMPSSLERLCGSVASLIGSEVDDVIYALFGDE